MSNKVTIKDIAIELSTIDLIVTHALNYQQIKTYYIKFNPKNIDYEIQ